MCPSFHQVVVVCGIGRHTIGLGKVPVGAVGCEEAVNWSSSEGLEVAAEVMVEYEQENEYVDGDGDGDAGTRRW